MAQAQPNPTPMLTPTEQPQIIATVVPARRSRPRFSAQERARRKSAGLVSNLSTLLFQPRLFFYTLPETRHWIIIAALSLLLVSYNGIRATQTTVVATDGSGFVDPFVSGEGASLEGDFGAFGGGNGLFGGGEVPIDDPFAAPIPGEEGVVDGGVTNGVASVDTTSQVTIGVRSGAWLVGIWFLQAILLMVVSLFNGKSPSLGKGLQIAVWSSVPLILMLIIQMVFHSAGGVGGAPGLSAALPKLDFYAQLDGDTQWLLTSAASQITLWSLWSLLLLYFGTRDALRGKLLLCLFVVFIWIGVAIAVPVLMGMAPLPPAGVPS